jgi:hypothetical protein
MDDSGVYAQVCFPNSIGLGGQGISDVVKDPELRLLCVQIYNDAAAEVQADSGGRLMVIPVLPAWDVNAAVAEARRVADLDLRGVNITSDPNDVGGPDLANRAWDPLWDGTLLFIGNARVVNNIILSGMLDRHPKLQMVSVESGVGWVPFILEALDYEMSENAPDQLDPLSMLPSEYLKRNLYATFWFERNNLPTLVESVGPDAHRDRRGNRCAGPRTPEPHTGGEPESSRGGRGGVHRPLQEGQAGAGPPRHVRERDADGAHELDDKESGAAGRQGQARPVPGIAHLKCPIPRGRDRQGSEMARNVPLQRSRRRHVRGAADGDRHTARAVGGRGGT